MKTRLEAQLYRTAARTFEELSFLLAQPPGEPEDRPPEDSPPEVVASVAFRGPVSGRLLLGCPRRLLGPLAANMLGEDEWPSELQQLDALMEMANVICGNLLPGIIGSTAVVTMEAPQVCEGEAMPPRSLADAMTRVVLDEGWADVLLYLEEGVDMQEGPS